MTVFLLCAAALVALALALVLPALLRRRTTGPAPTGANLLVLREQLAQLDADHAAGSIDAAQHALSRSEIERRALEEAPAEKPTGTTTRSARSAWVLGICVPLLAVGMYAMLGQPAAVNLVQASPQNPEAAYTPEQVEAMVKEIRQRLESQPEQPNAAEGWALLGRTYAAMRRFDEASVAFGKARAGRPGDAQLLADHADVLAMLQGQSMAGEPEALALKALQRDPDHIKALSLAGTAAFQRKDFAAAVGYWSRAQGLAPVGSELAIALARNVANAHTEAQVAGAGAAPAPSAAGASAPGAAMAAAASISGTVRVAPALAARVAPDDTVYIFARAAQGRACHWPSRSTRPASCRLPSGSTTAARWRPS